MGMVFTNGQMEEGMKVTGKRTSYITRVFTHGEMEESTKESILKIRNKGTVFIFGQMERSMKGIGKMESSMVKANSQILRARVEWVFGKMVTGKNGYLQQLRKLQ